MDPRIRYLHSRFISKSASIQELKELNSILESKSGKEAFLSLMLNMWNDSGQSVPEINEKEVHAAAEEILHLINKEKRAGKIMHLRWERVAAACMIVGLVLSILLVQQEFKPDRSGNLKATAYRQTDTTLSAASPTAKLILGDGSIHTIDDHSPGWHIDQHGATVARVAGILRYKEAGNRGVPIYNTLITGRGEMFPFLQLSDGTRVWLNAASSIKFPVSFKGMPTRNVTVSGEVYFEVAKNPTQPFMVKVGDDEITVLGTHFNVNAYQHESQNSVTLIEGAVWINHQGEKTVLRPGQCAFNVKGGKTKVDRVNISQVMGWKDNLFYFDHTPIKLALNQIALWYNLDINYQGNSKKTLTGQIPRDVPAKTLLKALQLTGNLGFKINGRSVEIYQL